MAEEILAGISLLLGVVFLCLLHITPPAPSATVSCAIDYYAQEAAMAQSTPPNLLERDFTQLRSDIESLLCRGNEAIVKSNQIIAWTHRLIMDSTQLSTEPDWPVARS